MTGTNKRSVVQNLFTGLHSSVLSHNSGKPTSIFSSLIDQFTGPELSQYAALITNFANKETAVLSEDCHLFDVKMFRAIGGAADFQQLQADINSFVDWSIKW